MRAEVESPVQRHVLQVARGQRLALGQSGGAGSSGGRGRGGRGGVPALPNIAQKSWVITGGRRRSRSRGGSARSRDRACCRGRLSVTLIRIDRASPGRTGRSQRTASMPGEPIELDCRMKPSGDQPHAQCAGVCHPEAINRRRSSSRAAASSVWRIADRTPGKSHDVRRALTARGPKSSVTPGVKILEAVAGHGYVRAALRAAGLARRELTQTPIKRRPPRPCGRADRLRRRNFGAQASTRATLVGISADGPAR